MLMCWGHVSVDVSGGGGTCVGGGGTRVDMFGGGGTYVLMCWGGT